MIVSEIYLNKLMNTFKVTLKQQIILLSSLFLKNGILILLIYFINGTLNTIGSFYTIIVIFFIDILPTIIVHIQYLLRNKGALFIVDTQNKTLEYRDKKSDLKYSFDDIDSLNYVASYGGGSRWYSFAEYRYKIILHDRNEIIITCLMMNNIKYNFEPLFKIKCDEYCKVLALI